MRYIKERIKHAVRFRHKRGFGVHSPFMFHLILYVIRDKEKQYQYPLEKEKEEGLSSQERKIFRLLSRLVRFLAVRKAVCFGNNMEKLVVYLQAVSHQMEIKTNQPTEIRSADFVFIGRDAQRILKEERFLPELVAGKRCVVVTDIFKNRFNSQLWRVLSEKATVSVDMMWYGILFFDDKLQKGHYHLII